MLFLQHCWMRTVFFSYALAASTFAAAPPEPFERHFVDDRFQRKITFYLERNPAAVKLPLAVFILGSGSASNFLVRDGRTLHAHRSFLKALDGRARLLVVEKAGVSFGSQPTRAGTALGSSEEFRREHTFDRWVEAISAAIGAARNLDGIDPARTLVAGHSEGAIVAAGVAAQNPFVTHVACLATNGATQLYTFLREARLGRFDSLGKTSDLQVAGLLEKWQDIRRHANDPNRLWLGHAYPRWASFMSRSVLEELPQTGAQIFIANGGEDGADPAASITARHLAIEG